MDKTNQVDFEVMKSALELHLKEMLAKNRCDELAIEYATKLDEETGVKGISFEEKVPSSSIKMTPYQNELALLQYTFEIERDNHNKKILEIRKSYRFDDRFKKISFANQTMIYESFFLGKTQKEIADSCKKSQQYIACKIREAIKKMAEVEL